MDVYLNKDLKATTVTPKYNLIVPGRNGGQRFVIYAASDTDARRLATRQMAELGRSPVLWVEHGLGYRGKVAS